MTDKFEFKNMHHTSALIETRNKPSLLEYKQIIIELSDAVSSLSEDNEKLNKQNDIAKIQNQELESFLNEKEIEISHLKQKIEFYEKETQSKVSFSERQTLENNQFKEELKRFNEEKEILLFKLRSEEENNMAILKVNEANEEKIRILEEQIEMLIKQNKAMKYELDREKSLNDWKIKDLKLFNDDLRRKYQVLEVENYHGRNISPFSSSKLHEFDLKLKKSFSTEKKARRNNGCLSTNPNFNVSREQIKPFYNEVKTEVIRPFSVSLNNPELGSELENLKKDIAHQYTLINLKNESYSKQRVNKTLEELKRKMGRAIHAAQDQESEFDYEM